MSTSAPRRTVDLIDRRVGLLFGLVLLLLALAVVRAVYLGTIRSSSLKAAAAVEHVDTVPIPAIRGEITDRSGVVLALSEAEDKLVADPYLIKRPQHVADELASLLGQTPAATLAALTKPHTGYSVLAASVPAATATKILDMGINGINEVPGERRVYPRGSEAAQAIGWTHSSGSGAAGLENLFNKQLSGTSGTRRIVNDALGKPIQVDTTKPMVPGKTLRLTISAPLQDEVEQVLANVGREYAPKGATAIVTDPQTDQILAVASWPSFNANDVTSADLQSVGGELPATEDQAVDFSYEPGSTFKAVTVAGALQDGVITPTTEFNIPPYLEAYGHTVSDAEPHGDEELNVGQILQVSSNIGAVKIGLKEGEDAFARWVNRFGFGKPTGVALAGEQQGIIRPLSQYYGFEMYNLPFGQGEEVTPMQMVQAYDAIANGGVLRTPQLIESIGGKKVAEPKGKRIISSQVAMQMRVMLRGVLADGGTASGAQIPGYDMAGKTGTANVAINGKYSNSAFVASFIGMVPASKPKLVVAVVVDQPSKNSIYGGSVAAPAFQSIVGWAVPHFGINPCPSPCPPSAMASATPNSL
ncbi:MAG TPA: penicillin-binding protein 2 [Solirubrobacteraceae bacterium]|nr:penicillin-binding protein 2 [Solirubrobacteraceae bacterium]